MFQTSIDIDDCSIPLRLRAPNHELKKMLLLAFWSTASIRIVSIACCVFIYWEWAKLSLLIFTQLCTTTGVQIKKIMTGTSRFISLALYSKNLLLVLSPLKEVKQYGVPEKTETQVVGFQDQKVFLFLVYTSMDRLFSFKKDTMNMVTESCMTDRLQTF